MHDDPIDDRRDAGSAAVAPEAADPLLPSPAFAAALEQQLRGELRRAARFDAGPRAGASPLARLGRLAAACTAAALLGACGVLAAQELDRRSSSHLLSEQFAVRFELARLREEAARAEVAALQPLLAQQMVSAEEFYAAEEQRVALAQEASVLGIDAIEVGHTGREPDRRLCAPRVDGRDLIGERLEQEIAALRFRVSNSLRRAQQLELRVQAGLVPAGEFEAARALHADRERQLAAAQERLEVRAAFLRGERDAFDVELDGLASEARVRRERASDELELAQVQAQRARQLAATGRVSTTEVGRLEREIAAASARRRLADLELATLEARRTERR